MPPSTLTVPSSGVSTNICRKERASSLAVAAGIKNADFTTATYRGMGRIAAADYWDGEAA